MTKCYFFGANEITVPNQKWTVKGKKRGMRKQKKRSAFVLAVALGCQMKKSLNG